MPKMHTNKHKMLLNYKLNTHTHTPDMYMVECIRINFNGLILNEHKAHTSLKNGVGANDDAWLQRI